MSTAVKAVVYAVEITLTRIEYEADEYGARIGESHRHELLSHYDGHLPEGEARDLYAHCDACFKRASGL